MKNYNVNYSIDGLSFNLSIDIETDDVDNIDQKLIYELSPNSLFSENDITINNITEK
jgi:hypothetical protein